jgi:hypothetical protein
MRCRGCGVMMDSVSNLETHCKKCVPCIQKIQAAGRATDRGESGFLPPAEEMVNASELFRLLPRGELSQVQLATPNPRPAHIASIARLPPLFPRSNTPPSVLDLSLSGFLSRVDSLLHEVTPTPEGGANVPSGNLQKKKKKKKKKNHAGKPAEQRFRRASSSSTPIGPGPKSRKRPVGPTRRPSAANQSRPSSGIRAPSDTADQDVIFLSRKSITATSKFQSQSFLGVVQSTRSPAGVSGSSQGCILHKKSRRKLFHQESERKEEEITFLRNVAAPVGHPQKPLFPHDFSEAEVDDMFRR